ncbi:MAG: hypothetical protein JO279_18895 [Verrucomicrobia bacterium]|nr:hypothetical protein [Verrucomicrobiota bacterium]
MKTKDQVQWKKPAIVLFTLLSVAILSSSFALGQVSPSTRTEKSVDFVMLPSKGLPSGVLQNALGHVHIRSVGPVEIMEVSVEGLPPNTDFDFFVIQVPNKPFGLSWYQGDIETNRNGKGFGAFVGRFSIETFIVSPGAQPAPVVFNNAFPDSSMGVVVGRIHTYHLGLWFNSPADGAKAGAPGVTPFNGEGDAGVQVLSTNGFPDLMGPLMQVN